MRRNVTISKFRTVIFKVSSAKYSDLISTCCCQTVAMHDRYQRTPLLLQLGLCLACCQVVRQLAGLRKLKEPIQSKETLGQRQVLVPTNKECQNELQGHDTNTDTTNTVHCD